MAGIKIFLNDTKSYIILNNRGKQEQHEQKSGGGKVQGTVRHIFRAE